MDAAMGAIAKGVGKPEDQVRLLVLMAIQIPIGFFINVFLKEKLQRHLFNIMVGVALQIYMYRWEVVHIYIIAYSTYAIMMLAPRAE